MCTAHVWLGWIYILFSQANDENTVFRRLLKELLLLRISQNRTSKVSGPAV